jgi:hypothetical protein
MKPLPHGATLLAALALAAPAAATPLLGGPAVDLVAPPPALQAPWPEADALLAANFDGIDRIGVVFPGERAVPRRP